MEKSAGEHPIVTLFSLLVGFKLAGILGAVLSVPVVITLYAILEEIFLNGSLSHDKTTS